MGQKGYHLIRRHQFKGKTYLQNWVHQWVERGFAVSELGDWLFSAREEVLRRERVRKEGIPRKRHLPPIIPRPQATTTALGTVSTRSSTPQRQEFAMRRGRDSGSLCSPERPRTCPPRYIRTCVDWGCTNTLPTNPECTEEHCTAAYNKQHSQSLKSKVKVSGIDTEIDTSHHNFGQEKSVSTALGKVRENLQANVVNACWQLNVLREMEGSSGYADLHINRTAGISDEGMFSEPLSDIEYQKYIITSSHLQALRIDDGGSTISDDCKMIYTKDLSSSRREDMDVDCFSEGGSQNHSYRSTSPMSDSFYSSTSEKLNVDSSRTIDVMPGNEWLEAKYGLKGYV